VSAPEAGPAEDWGSWESTRERSLLAGLAVTADERIAWVEEMLQIAIASGACPRPRDAWGQPIVGDLALLDARLLDEHDR
jgi:hypothetical protein